MLSVLLFVAGAASNGDSNSHKINKNELWLIGDDANNRNARTPDKNGRGQEKDKNNSAEPPRVPEVYGASPDSVETGPLIETRPWKSFRMQK
jgi:hypothetical protein